MSEILVPFEGDGSGVEELTWGQRRIWSATRISGLSINMGGAVRVPAGFTTQDVAASLRFLVGRHQALRTRLEFTDDGELRQAVAAGGEMPLEVIDAGDGDPAEAAAAVKERYQATNFHRDHEWPLRNAVIVQNGAVTHSVAVYSQLAIDAYSLDALVADLARMDPETGEATAPPPQLQPLDLARRQRESSALRVNKAAMRHWERVLREMPARQFGEERAEADRSTPRYWELGYNSPATHLAARIVAARDQTDSGAVLLAAFAVALAGVTGINPVMVGLLVSNRFRPGLADIISPLAQIGPCLIDVADGTFDDVVERAQRGMLGAGMNAYYDPRQLDALVAAVSAARGEEIELSCVFNDRRRASRDAGDGPLPTPEQVREALPRSAERLQAKLDRPNRKLFVHINDVRDTVEVVMRGDTHFISPAQLSACLRGMEATIVDAACDVSRRTSGGTPLGRFRV
jgi:hypothetical protein